MVLHCYGSPCLNLEAAWPGVCAPEHSQKKTPQTPLRSQEPVRQQDLGPGGAAQGSGVLGGSRSSSSPCRGSYCVFSLQALWFSEWDLLLGWEVAALPDVLIGDRQVRGSHARGVLGGHTGVSTPKHPTHSPCATPRIIPVRINPKLICQVGMERVRPCSQPL